MEDPYGGDRIQLEDALYAAEELDDGVLYIGEGTLEVPPLTIPGGIQLVGGQVEGPMWTQGSRRTQLTLDLTQVQERDATLLTVDLTNGEAALLRSLNLIVPTLHDTLTPYAGAASGRRGWNATGVRVLGGAAAELYEIEARAKAKAKGDESQLRNHRAVFRAVESKAVIDKIDSWRARQFALPDSKMHDGLKYLKNQWPKLIRFIDDLVIPLDNNLAERQVRAPVLGRRNHLGSHSERGAHVSALFYSL
ncbi:MAG: hypothetical protein ACI9MR_003330, partial [Myxococcota bacterium]